MYFIIKWVILLNALSNCYGDWVSDWMSPVQDQFKNARAPKSNGFLDASILHKEEEKPRAEEMKKNHNPIEDQRIFDSLFAYKDPHSFDDVVESSLLRMLDGTLVDAKLFSNTLQGQIAEISGREKILKEAIVNGRYGITTAKVFSMNRLPRQYIVRDGTWSLCDGVLQHPTPQTMRVFTNPFSDIYTTPVCIGREIVASEDPCSFNSVIKYETIPLVKTTEYKEDNYLCLKHNFNDTMEQYLSVPRNVMNATCKNGAIRSFRDNDNACSVRTLTEYTYFPYKTTSANNVPLEFCSQSDDGSCKLIVAWHIDNANGTVDNFQFLKDEPNFKKHFIQVTAPYLKQTFSIM